MCRLLLLSEMVLKMIAYGVRAYATDTMNAFDGLVVFAALPALVMPMVTGSISNDNALSSVSALRVVRVFRVLRLARLFHKLQALRDLLVCATQSVASIAQLSLFIAFFLVTFALLASNLFARPYAPSHDVALALNSDGFSRYAGGPVPRFHFDSFWESLLSLFIIMTGMRRCSS
jgi:voltage-dependent calcium channel L type alpha-1D